MDDSKQSGASRACQHARAWVCSPKPGELSSFRLDDAGCACTFLLCISNVYLCIRLGIVFGGASVFLATQTEIRTAAICWQYLDRFTPGGPIMQMHSFDCSFRQSCTKWTQRLHRQEKHERHHRWPGTCIQHQQSHTWKNLMGFSGRSTSTCNMQCGRVWFCSSFKSTCTAGTCRSKWAKRSYTLAKMLQRNRPRSGKSVNIVRLEVLGVLPHTTPNTQMSLPQQIDSVSDIISAASPSPLACPVPQSPKHSRYLNCWNKWTGVVLSRVNDTSDSHT